MKRTRGVLAAVAVTATLMAAFGGASAAAEGPAGSPAGSSAAPAPVADSPNGRWIVRYRDPADAARADAVLRSTGVRVLATLPEVGMTVIGGSHAAVTRAAALPAVLLVSADAQVKPQSLGFAPSSQPGSMTNVTRITGAQAAWKAGFTGAGVDVAVLDTGVAPVPSLKDPAKVVVGPDLSFESQAPNLRYLDSFGHGTAMSSIIGGREIAKASGATYAADTTNFLGMAPDSRILSLKLGDRNGTVDVSQLIAGIDWVVQNRKSNGLNVRVLNLSFGLDSDDLPPSDPLAFAAENAWNKGIFVVASAGNDGQGLRRLAMPAASAYIFAVGANDTRGTDTMADDAVPAFSQHQGSSLLNRPPDVLAPGVKIVSAGVPGSTIYNGYPAARVGNGLIRGSGTSQAAAVVSGAAALLLQRWPSMTPDAVKELLIRTATPLAGVDRKVQGYGELNVIRALATTPLASAPPQHTKSIISGSDVRPAIGSGSVDETRGDNRLVMDGKPLKGRVDIFGAEWDSRDLADAAAKDRAWGADGTFNGNQWIGPGFATDTTSVAGRT